MARNLTTIMFLLATSVSNPDLARAGGSQLSAIQLDEAIQKVDLLLGQSLGKVEIAIKASNRLRVGDEVVFEAQSNLPGRLVILDVNAQREVTLIYPNRFVPANDRGRVVAGQRVTVPGPGYAGFTGFRAVEPTGKGHLLAFVVPNDFDVERFAAAPEIVTKGFQPVGIPQSYLMRLIQQIEKALAANARLGGTAGETLQHWGFANAEYEIVP